MGAKPVIFFDNGIRGRFYFHGHCPPCLIPEFNQENLLGPSTPPQKTKQYRFSGSVRYITALVYMGPVLFLIRINDIAPCSEKIITVMA